jgi:DNA topoisomerase I
MKTFTEAADVKILNGRWGPYIEFGKQNVKIPRGRDPLALTYEDCKALADAEAKAPKKAGGRKFAKKK